MDTSLDDDEKSLFTAFAVIFSLFVLLVLKTTFSSLKIVHQAEVMIVERFGKYQRTLKPGIHWIWPLIESPRMINWRFMNVENNSSEAHIVSIVTDRIDMREHVLDFGKQHVITRDTVQIVIDALVYFRVSDPRLAVFKINNLPDAVELLTQSTLRNIIAHMTLDDTFSSREKINEELLSKIQLDSERWGVTITRVEIFNITPPPDVIRAMQLQIKAERTRRSDVLKADGNRLASVIQSHGKAAQLVLHAEGDRASDVLKAQGSATAQIMLADAQAKCLEHISKAVSVYGVKAVEYLTAIQYLNALRNLTVSRGGDKVVMFPSECVNSIEELIRLNSGRVVSSTSKND
jgi:regulator of protease activity HflC (stomatin/prohibitin superfamily)